MKEIRRDEHGCIKSYSHITKDELVCAGTIVDGMDCRIEEILDRCNAHVVSEQYQSRVNYYVKYDYKPFDTTMFLRQFIVHGTPKFLTWVNEKLNNYLDAQELCEHCFMAKAVTPIHEITFKID